MALILEVLDAREGGVRVRIRLDALPVRIGRGLDNELILDDPYVDAQHAHITRDETGDIVVEDLGSTNGVIVRDGRVARVHAHPGTALTLGRTILRFRDSVEAVPPALRDHPRRARTVPRWFATPWGQVGLCAAAFAAFGISMWLDSYNRSAATDTFTALLGLGGIVALWAGSWAIAGRIVIQRFRFLAHCAVFSFFVLCFFATGMVNTWAVFLFPDNPVSSAAGATVTLAFVAALVACHLGVATALPARRRWQAGVIVTVVILALMGVGALTADDTFSDVPEFGGTVKAWSERWVPTHSIAEFGETVAELQHEVDALIEE